MCVLVKRALGESECEDTCECCTPTSGSGELEKQKKKQAGEMICGLRMELMCFNNQVFQPASLQLPELYVWDSCV